MGQQNNALGLGRRSVAGARRAARAGSGAALWAMLALPLAAAAAEPTPTTAAGAQQPAAEAQKPPEPKAVRTQGEVRIDGEVVRYTATVGWLIMKDDDGKPIARFGYTAYTRDGVQGPRATAGARSPTTAARARRRSGCTWASSGPRRVVVNDPGYAPPPPVASASTTSTACSTSPTS